MGLYVKTKRIGRTRKKLAEKLNAKFPEYHFNPEDLWVQYPIYASIYYGCAKWGGTGYHKELNLCLTVHSWDSMGEFIKKDREISLIGDFELTGTEICPIEKQPLESAVSK